MRTDSRRRKPSLLAQNNGLPLLRKTSIFRCFSPRPPPLPFTPLPPTSPLLPAVPALSLPNTSHSFLSVLLVLLSHRPIFQLSTSSSSYFTNLSSTLHILFLFLPLPPSSALHDLLFITHRLVSSVLSVLSLSYTVKLSSSPILLLMQCIFLLFLL